MNHIIKYSVRINPSDVLVQPFFLPLSDPDLSNMVHIVDANNKFCSLIYQGFVISDWQGIDRLTSPPSSNYTYSVQASIEAGVDMVSPLFMLKLPVGLE